MLEASLLTKCYSGIPVVDRVSFVIRPGEILGYLGPNGAGKSTTVKMLTGLLEPSFGQIFFHGQNVRADAQSDDKFTRRARPGVIWVGLFIMAWSYVVIPVLSIHWSFLKPVEFPAMFWETWGVIATGVVVTRSADKLFGGAGGSLQLPFGVRADSKGN